MNSKQIELSCPPPSPQSHVSVGDIVLYTYQDCDLSPTHTGKARPAIVIEVHQEQYHHDTGSTEPGYDLRVFTGDEGGARNVSAYFIYGCRLDPEGRPGTCRLR